MRKTFPIVLTLLLACVAVAPARETPATQPSNSDRPLLIHLPGIAGHRSYDDRMTRGIVEGGVDAEIFVYDWPGVDAGLLALIKEIRHVSESERLAGLITKIARENPNRRIIITSHSGGAGIAAWALAQLPEGVQIEAWLMLAPALSPEFDLTAALKHVRGPAYAFHSTYDPVLGWGTQMFGTIDGVRTYAAGKTGFLTPPTADAAQYAKLRQFAYDRAWMPAGYIGDHISLMSRKFAVRVLAPLMINGELPLLVTPSTQPSNK